MSGGEARLLLQSMQGDAVLAMPMTDRAILSLVRLWCFLRYPRVCSRTFRRSRVLPDPARPSSDVDKFLWRKLFDHNPLFTIACDKLAAKKHALSICPDLRTARVLWVGTDPALIPADLLAGSVVVKASHGSRWNVMVHNGKVDRAAMCQRARRWMRRRYGRSFGEWGYRNATRALFVEEMLLEAGQPVRTEYKFHVSAGRTRFVFISQRNEQESDRWCCLERDGRALRAPPDAHDGWAAIGPPASFERMRGFAETLAAPFDHMRCDFYELDRDVFFSELTVYPLSGQGVVDPRLTELRNSAWDLRKSWFLTRRQTGWRGLYAAALRRWLDRNASPADAS